MEQRMQNRFKQTQSLEELADQAQRLHEQAEMLPHGRLRETVERKARQTETASYIGDWLWSPGLQAPK